MYNNRGGRLSRPRRPPSTPHQTPQSRIYRTDCNSQQNGNAVVALMRQKYSVPNYGDQLLSSFAKLRNDGLFFDVEISVDTKVFSAHKVILAAASPYFKAMFGSSGLTESHDNKATIKDISPDIFERLLNYIYTGEFSMDQETCQDLLSAANMLGLPTVVLRCCEFLECHLHPSNCLGIFLFAEMHACDKLKIAAKRFMENKFSEFMQEDEFFDMPKDTLKNFLKSEGISIQSEQQLFDAVMRWVNHSLEKRKKDAADLLEEIRFAVIPKRHLSQYLEQHVQDPDLRFAIENAIEKSIRIQHEEAQQGFDVRTQPRMCTRKSIYILGGTHHAPNQRYGEECTLKTTEKLDLFHGFWSVLVPMHTPRARHGTTVLDNTIYVAGGEECHAIMDLCEALETDGKSWRKIASLNIARASFGLCAIHGMLYALGGCIGHQITSTIERYDPHQNKWELLSEELPGPRQAMGVVAHKGLIYVVGGTDEHHQCVNTAFSFNPVTKQWTPLSPMLSARADMGIAILHDHIYIVGGFGLRSRALTSTERYNIEDNAWREIPPLRVARIGCSAAAVSNHLYVIGGRSMPSVQHPGTTMDDVLVYRPEANQWSLSINRPSTSRCDAGIVVL